MGIEDLMKCYNKSGSEAHQLNELKRVTFDIVMLPKGKGLKFIGSQEGDRDRETSGDGLKGDDDDDDKELT